MSDPLDMNAPDQGPSEDLREQAVLKPGVIGSAIRVSPAQAGSYERGVNRISAARLAQIARVLDVSVAELPDGRQGIQSALSDKAVAIARKFDALEERDQNAVSAMIDTLSTSGDDPDVS